MKTVEWRMTKSAESFLSGTDIHVETGLVLETVEGLGERAADHPDQPLVLVFTREMPGVYGRAYAPTKRRPERLIRLALAERKVHRSTWIGRETYLERRTTFQVNRTLTHELVHAVDFLDPAIMQQQIHFRENMRDERPFFRHFGGLALTTAQIDDLLRNSPLETRAYDYVASLERESMIPEIVSFSDDR